MASALLIIGAWIGAAVAVSLVSARLFALASRRPVSSWYALSIGLPPTLPLLMTALPFELGGDLLWVLPALLLGGLLLVAALLEMLVGAATSRCLFLDGALRASALLAAYFLAFPLGGAVEIGTSWLSTFNPAYACRTTSCADEIVNQVTFGGMMALPSCYDQIVRLGDPRGGRAAAVHALRPGPSMLAHYTTEQLADEASLVSLGRGFYHAQTCDYFYD